MVTNLEHFGQKLYVATQLEIHIKDRHIEIV